MTDEFKRQGTPAEMETGLREWLKTKRKQKGEGDTIKEDTQDNYVTTMKNSIRFFGDEYKKYGYNSVFEVKDPDTFEKIMADVEANKIKHPSQDSFRNVRSGMKAYLSFLRGEDPNQPGTVVNPPGSGDGTKKVSSKYENQRNLIFFGAPGTGKSFLLNKEKDLLLGSDADRCERVTFHPDYSYAHFVGTYKPKSDGNGGIRYEYTPGPFLRIYVEARKHPDRKYVLLIEEINRANVAAVFGDVFQLLDRKDGESEYPINASEDMRNYLEGDGQLGKDSVYGRRISIPGNMYIWATMNSADQGVFPMDTAFKRRWEFEYLGIDTGDDKIKDFEVPMGKDNVPMKWNDVRKFINRRLAELEINEDKQLGAFFINMEIIARAKADPATFKNTFKNKVLMYLFEDAARHKRDKMFDVRIKGVKDMEMRYSKVCSKFDDYGMAVFKGYGNTSDGTGEQTGKDDRAGQNGGRE